MNSFEKLIIAHLIADFLLQNNWMALNKTEKLIPLFVHGLIYAVCLFVAFPELGFICIYFLSMLHCLVDQLSLADKWLWLIRGRTFKDIQYKDKVYISFTCIVYVVVDFLLHFLITYPIILYFMDK